MSRFDSFTWRCDICHEERPDSKISVYKVDIGPRSLPSGTLVRNVKYCNDNSRCYEGALHWSEEDYLMRQRVKV
jgi:hypothetical protein